MTAKISVCVIGAGAAGLCAGRHLSADAETFDYAIYEQTGEIGGTWVFTEEVGVDSYGLPVHSSMYKNLRTNIPQEIMAFPDFPFPEAGDSSYPSHDVVLRYLQDYAAHFDLHRKIRFRTVVRGVTPAGTGWAVTVYSLETQVEETLRYDAVLVCNGHYSEPLVPAIRDIELFGGTVEHSHDYRAPDAYAGKKVALLGAAASGRDIALELAGTAHMVYLCHDNTPLASQLPDNVVQATGVAAATEEGFLLKDGSAIEVDALVACTGYRYSFPFLSRACGVRVRGRRVRPLFRHLVHIDRPTMALVGVVFIVVPFPLFHYQVLFFLKMLKDPSALPSREEMLKEEESEFRLRIDRGLPPRYAHRMDDLQWPYNDSLADAAGVARLHPVYRRLYRHNGALMRAHLATYKRRSFQDCFAAGPQPWDAPEGDGSAPDHPCCGVIAC